MTAVITWNEQLTVGHLIREHGRQLGFKSPIPVIMSWRLTENWALSVWIVCGVLLQDTNLNHLIVYCTHYFPKFQLHLFPGQGFTSFPKIKEPPQNSRHQSSDIEQGCWGRAGIRPHHEKLVSFVTLHLAFVHPCLEWYHSSVCVPAIVLGTRQVHQNFCNFYCVVYW
jgi:hypothetical protein